jgi:hypothetical protein
MGKKKRKINYLLLNISYSGHAQGEGGKWNDSHSSLIT